MLLASLATGVLLASGVATLEAVSPAQAVFPGANGKIVFAQYEEGYYRMKFINPRGSNATTLEGITDGISPAVSPDGTRVAYSAYDAEGRDSEIYKYNIVTRRVTQITDNRVDDVDPTWSPYGTRIAFARDKDEAFRRMDTDIFAKRSDGTGAAVNLTKTPAENELAPAWSPNARKMACHTGTSSPY